MKDRGTYFLLALFFSGLVGLWLLDFARVPTRKQRDRLSSRVLPELINLKPDDLRKVEILGGEGPIVFERREGNRWQMTSPVDVAADPSKVETFAYNLKELSRRPDSATIEGDLSQFGLTPPERTVKLWGAATDAPLASLEIGLTSLDRRYVRQVGSDGIEVVDAKGLDLLKLPAIRWRDHEMFRVPSFEVDAVTLSSKTGKLKLGRGRNTWRVVEPVRLVASEARVDGLVADLGSLRVLDDSRFVADNVKPAELARFGLDTPVLTIEVDPGRVERRRGLQVLHVGKPVEGKAGQVYARRGDQDDVVILDQRVLKDLKPEPNAFRSAKVADLSLPRVLKIGVEAADGTTLEVARRGNDWVVASPSTVKGDRQAIQDFLKALDQLQTGTYLGPNFLPESGLDKPSLTLKVWQVREPNGPTSTSGSADPNGELTVNLRIGRRDVARKTIYAQIEGDPTILALPDSVNDFLPRNPLAFRDRQILALDVPQIEQFKFVGQTRKFTINAPLFKPEKLDLALPPQGWWLAEPVQTPADPPSMGRLLRLMANLRAEALVTEKPGDLEKYGLKSPALTVAWSRLPEFSMIEKPLKAGRSPGSIELEEYTMLIGSPLPDRPNVRYAKLGDQPLIFTLGAETLAILDAEWRDHRVVSFEVPKVRKVTLDWPERRLSLAQAGPGRWSVEADEDVPDFDASSVQPILQAASKLTTTRFAQYLGDFREGAGLDPARLTIRIELDDGSGPRTLRIGGQAGGGQVVATTDTGRSGAIFFLPEALFAPLLKAPVLRGELPDKVFAP